MLTSQYALRLTPARACIAQARRAAVRGDVRITQAAHASALAGAEKVPLHFWAPD